MKWMNKELKKDRECIHCEKFFDCAGKPEKVKLCVNFVERKDEDGREKNVCKNNN